MKETTITPKNLNTFVIAFYKRILEDKELSPFFIKILGSDIKNDKWQNHIKRLTAFWSAMLIKEEAYYGSPFSPHAKMKELKRESFEKWLVVLDEVLDKHYEKEPAKQIRAVGEKVCDSFMRRLLL
jgi:hemoglobin